MFRSGNRVALQAKSGKTLSRYFPEVLANVSAIHAKQFVLDGELTIPVGSNLAFDSLQMRLSRLNRLYLAAQLPNPIEMARRSGQPLAILFRDLDRFKHINDSRGHETGNQLLQAVAQRICDTTREQDMVVRMGGGEFIVVLKETFSLEQVHLMAGRLIEALSHHSTSKGGRWYDGQYRREPAGRRMRAPSFG